jgi:hypothetical protein
MPAKQKTKSANYDKLVEMTKNHVDNGWGSVDKLAKLAKKGVDISSAVKALESYLPNDQEDIDEITDQITYGDTWAGVVSLEAAEALAWQYWNKKQFAKIDKLLKDKLQYGTSGAMDALLELAKQGKDMARFIPSLAGLLEAFCGWKAEQVLGQFMQGSKMNANKVFVEIKKQKLDNKNKNVSMALKKCAHNLFIGCPDK